MEADHIVLDLGDGADAFLAHLKQRTHAAPAHGVIRGLAALSAVVLLAGLPGCGDSDDDGDSAVPEPGTGFQLERVSGVVKVAPGDAAAFDLTKPTRVPNGTRVNAVGGAVEVTAALPDGGEQRARMSAGRFSLSNRQGGALTEITLRGTTCGRPSTSSRETRRLFGEGKGNFTTRGRFGSAGVRGTRWGVRDRCDGTLIVAREGTVIAEDFVTGRMVTLRAPRSYLARAR